MSGAVVRGFSLVRNQSGQLYSVTPRLILPCAGNHPTYLAYFAVAAVVVAAVAPARIDGLVAHSHSQ